MALPITDKTDYTGVVKITTQTGSQLTEFITEFEMFYIRMLLNDQVFNDINTLPNPLPQKYLDLINGVNYTNEDGDFVAYQGFKRVLLRMIYGEFLSKNFQASISGNVRSFNENSEVLVPENSVVVALKFNEGIRIYEQEVWAFLDEFRELDEEITSSSEVAGTYTLGVASTRYLDNGFTVTIGDTDYVVANVVTDTSFDITDVTGKDFTGLTVKYEPFYEIEFINVKPNSFI
jgi:hypothetical protein